MQGTSGHPAVESVGPALLVNFSRMSQSRAPVPSLRPLSAAGLRPPPSQHLIHDAAHVALAPSMQQHSLSSASTSRRPATASAASAALRRSGAAALPARSHAPHTFSSSGAAAATTTLTNSIKRHHHHQHGAAETDPAVAFAADAATLALIEIGTELIECERYAHALRLLNDDYRAAIEFIVEDMAPDAVTDEACAGAAAGQAMSALTQQGGSANAVSTPMSASLASSASDALDPLEAILKLSREIRNAQPPAISVRCRFLFVSLTLCASKHTRPQRPHVVYLCIFDFMQFNQHTLFHSCVFIRLYPKSTEQQQQNPTAAASSHDAPVDEAEAAFQRDLRGGLTAPAARRVIQARGGQR